MFFDEILHGTQYYRAPTPLADEWEGDLARFADFNLGLMQIRVNWRWNEVEEGKYDFSDVDKLMDLAEKYNVKVVIKLLLECAPQYVFDKYGGTRIGPKGEQFRGGAHGAFYGGWRPCFTNPKVQKAAVKFVEQVAKRYAGRKNLLFWNAWNEIRNRPVEDCFCPHCRTAFGGYLRKKFGDIRKLNAFYGTAEDGFDTIALPSMPHGVWDMYEFKKFKGSADLSSWLTFVYDAIRKYDKTRPIMSHVGFTSAFQYTLNDVCDDYGVSKSVDFWGTSVPCDSEMDTDARRLDFLMLNDFLRSVDENYFVYEIYPGLGMFKWYDEPYDMRFKLYASLACGAKGMLYWQYRAERLASESDCAGIMRMDGTPRPVAYEAQAFGETLQKGKADFVGARAKKADVGIVFDFDSMLLSEIEDDSGKDFTFEPVDPVHYYRNAHAGFYRMLRQNDYEVDYVGVTQTEKFKDYKILYFPYYTMLKKEIVPHLQAFLEQGGRIIADEGFGMRQENTWMQPYDIACKPILNARMQERRRIQKAEFVEINGARVQISPFKSAYNVENGAIEARFEDGTPAIQSVEYGAGKVYLSSFSLGYSYYERESDEIFRFVKSILDEKGVQKHKYSNFKDGIYEKRLTKSGKDVVFLFNTTDEEKCVTLTEKVSKVGLGEICGDVLKIAPKTTAYFVTE